jgi:hypothetical protein
LDDPKNSCGPWVPVHSVNQLQKNFIQLLGQRWTLLDPENQNANRAWGDRENKTFSSPLAKVVPVTAENF